MATQNSINNTSNPIADTAVTIDPGVSGDSYIQYNINTTGEFRIGVDDSDSDAFKIAQGSALETNTTFVMSAAGERTMPLQPAFLAHIASNDNNVTGVNSYAVGTNTAYTEIFDQNGDFNTNGVFTAPVTGQYHFQTSLKFGGIVAGNAGRIAYSTSNRAYWSVHMNTSAVKDSSSIYSYAMETLADMDAADTCYINLNLTGEASDVNDILGQATDPISWFCGYLAV